ncbi:PREDICTED: putative F-box protein At2g33200 [Camelina sativa]|uniref:F-box protein At2g33200 n=1 Tax=Camelina sativa TaxID=90675 RepID=A0ABM0Z3J3_CAMSA|nr:PREDICTED: putative F-box protein At2g33200 [Camelina sativa]
MSRSRTCYDWSKLCHDLLPSILERLHYKDYHRARTVCSNWYTVSTTCKRPLYPWRVVFNESSALIFDPGEEQTHEIQHPGADFSERYVLASCSNWFLMVDSCLGFYLVNVFTRERINLPSMESSILGKERVDQEVEWKHYIKRTDMVSIKKQACLWINERTGDYVVAWSVKQHYLFTYKRGDDSWSNLQGAKCVSMVFDKEYKLYVYTADNYIKIFDLSGDLPEEIVGMNPYRNHMFSFRSVSKRGEHIWKQRVAVTNSGEVLMIVSLKGLEDKRLFYIYKMNLGSCKWERVDSLGGEMLIFGHGVTVRAPIKDINGLGIKSDSICLRDGDLWPVSFYFDIVQLPNFGVFDLATSTITSPKSLDVSFKKSFWFVPGYA